MKRRTYPPDIQARVNENIERDVTFHLDRYKEAIPDWDYSELYYQEHYFRDLASWWNEPPPNFSDDEIREQLGLPVKSQEEIESEVLNSPRRTGFTVEEITGLNLLDKGTHY